MITIEQPAMAPNASDVKARHGMWYTWGYFDRERLGSIFSRVRATAEGAPGGKLRHLVMNCHGSPGELHIGRNSLSGLKTLWFREWRDKIDKIWLLACEPARIQVFGSTYDGDAFVADIARAANCYAVASTAIQFARPRTYPFGKIDSFEGRVLSYAPDGHVSWTHEYDSRWRRNRE